MLAVISPAKSLDFQRPLPAAAPSRPRFEGETARLVAAARRLSRRQLADVMGISETLAELNVSRYRDWDGLPECPALFAFSGDVYAGFDAPSLPEEGVRFAQNHLRILSGLYGLLRPLDLIRPYRLEMGTRWAPRAGNLYAFWRDRIGRALAEDVAAAGGAPVVINLASKEYWQAAAPHLPAGVRGLCVDFREDGPGGLKFNSFAGKRARGAMARFLCEHRLADPAALKGFDAGGYVYDAELSNENRWMFVRR